MQVRVFNDFKRRLLNGEVSADFPCTAVLLNSTYDNMYNYAAYFRNIADFNAYSAMSIYDVVDSTRGNIYTGALLAKGKELETVFYRDTDLNDTDTESDLMIVTSATSATYRAKYARGNETQNARFEDYINKYGYFYLVARSDDFHALVTRTQDLDLEKFVVVLADNIEHLDVTGSCFGCSREHPFRGVFDGNGYALCINSMSINTRSNGIFGYISDEAKVCNLIVSADSTNLDGSDSEISVINSEQISLNTLKAGLGDVKFGVLAGENNGTIENVLIDAKIKYKTDFTPSFCFVQNKTDYPTTFIGDAWNRLTSTAFSNASALSSFDNLCYPTPLCMNSEANLIPYIGYFNEGGINNQGVKWGKQLHQPFYTNTRDNNTLLYLTDIYDVYKVHAVDPDTHSRSLYFEVLGDNHSVVENNVAMSFRLGPNNRQAYLLGGMFGLNNGDISNCVCDVRMKFEDNFVALVGGLAGRGARGVIDNVKTRAEFVGTSGVYTHDYQLTNDKRTNAPASAMLTEANFGVYTTLDTPEKLATFSPSQLDSFRYNTGTFKIVSDITRNFSPLLSAVLNTGDRSLSADLRGTLTLIGSGYQLTESETHLTNVDVAGKDICLIYNFDVTGTRWNDDTQYIEPLYTIDIYDNWSTDTPNTRTIHLSNKLLYEKDNLPLKYSLSTTNLYAISSRNTNGIKLLTAKTDLLLATATDTTHYDIDPDPSHNKNRISVKDLTLRSDYAFYKYEVATSVYDAVSGYLTFNLSAYNSPKITYDTNDADSVRALTTMQENGSINIRLSPVYNMGGMFGEYIYSDAQSITRSMTCAKARDFKHVVNNKSTHGFKRFNNISHFASNIVIDSSNKSNSDMFTNSWAASANSRVKNPLKFFVANVLADEPEQYLSAVENSDDCLSGIKPIHSLCVYNHITPSVVTTHYTDKDDHDIGNDAAPNVGITWLDQLFYSYGINMGDNYTNDDADPAMTLFKQYNNPSSNSGLYFNFPAQGSVFGALYYGAPSPVSANNDSDRYDNRLWKYDTLFNSTFDTNVGSTYGYFSEHYDIYVTKQLTAYPHHYPLYRGRASINEGGQFTFDPSAYLTINKSAPRAAYSAIDDGKKELLTQENDIHSEITTESYIYEYTQRVIDDHLPQLRAHMYNIYGEYNGSKTDVEIHNAYAISSDSHEAVYKRNQFALTSMNQVTCNITVPETAFRNTFDINIDGATMTECATGAIVKFTLDSLYNPNDVPSLSVSYDNFIELATYNAVGDYYTRLILPGPTADGVANANSAMAEVYENSLYIKYPITIPVIDEQVYLTVPLVLSYSADVPKTAKTTAHIPITRTSITATDNLLKLEKNRNTLDVLSANTLCFGFVPTEESIIHILDSDIHTSAYARTLSSDDISYMLLLDDKQRPILDMKMDTTAVASAGYYFEFEGFRKKPFTPKLSAGLAINITD